MAGNTFISDIREKLERNSRSFSLKGIFLVHDKQVPLNKNGNPYLALVLKDRDGTLNAKMWDNVEDTERREAFTAGDFVKVECEAQIYRGQPQLKIKKLNKVPAPPADQLVDFLGSTQRNPQVMLNEARVLIESMQHKDLRTMLLTRLDDPIFSESLARSPAAKTNHHAHLGGLLEHTLSIMQLADALAQHYPTLDRDLLVAGAFLHDLGKMRELTSDATFAYTDEGNLVGHLVIGAMLVEDWAGELAGIDADLRLKLVHMILSHHGKKEFGSPVVPKFPEALALHFLDNLDSKLQSMFEVAAQESGQRWSSYQRQFESYLFLGAQKTETPADKPEPSPRTPADLTHRPFAKSLEKAGVEDETHGKNAELFSADDQDEQGRRPK